MQEMARNVDLPYRGIDDDGYPIFSQELFESGTNKKDYVELNRRHIEVLQSINRRKRAGDLLSQSANLARLRELEKIERDRPHRDLHSFEN
jgi:hypothetical protein